MSNGRNGIAACQIALKSRIFMLVAVIAICSSLFASYRIRVERGFPDTIGTGAWGRALFAFGAAIAQMRHGGYGYTIPDAMETVLTYGGLTGKLKDTDRYREEISGESARSSSH